MKNVLLVSIWDVKNFGNRLQAFALKNMIKSFGYDVTFAVYNKYGCKYMIKQKLKTLLGFLGVPSLRGYYLIYIRSHTFGKSKDYFTPTIGPFYLFHTKGKVDPNNYVAAVTGSDQVWHNWGNANELPYFYLSFMPEEKRISYAASFGFDEFPKEDLAKHAEGLKGMRFISCREETGCKLVEKVTGTPGTLVLDPTLCVDRDFWMKLEEKPEYISSEPYLLVFMLGNQEKYREAISSYAKQNNLQIIDLYDIHFEEVWSTTIGNFLWLVHHAELICTDSFHCTAFSITFERPFQVFRRQGIGHEKMYNRIETLLNLTSLEACQFDGESVKMIEPDFTYALNQLETEKNRSLEWLRNAIENVEKDQ